MQGEKGKEGGKRSSCENPGQIMSNLVFKSRHIVDRVACTDSQTRSTSNRELISYSIILHVQVLSVGFQGGRVSHVSIVGRRGEETNEGETLTL